MNYIQDLREWRKERNISNANTKVFVLNTIEELLEIYFEGKCVIDDNKHTIWNAFFTDADGNDLQPIGESNTIDTIQDIQVFCINETELMGYDNNLTMNETIKEISSRVQNPQQKLEWQENGAVGKWQKWQEQDKDTLYKANYIDCKLPK